MSANYKSSAIIEAVLADAIILNLLECYFSYLPDILGVSPDECEDSQCHAVRLALFKLSTRMRPMLAHAAWVHYNGTCRTFDQQAVTFGDCYTALKWLYDHLAHDESDLCDPHNCAVCGRCMRTDLCTLSE